MIYINQTGYPPVSKKRFLITADAAGTIVNFSVVRAEDGEQVFDGTLISEKLDDRKLSGMILRQGDFSDLETPGRYRIVYGSAASSEFSISQSVYHSLAADSLRTISLIRANIHIDDPLTGLKHPAAHLEDRNITGKDYSGGWYNAGDYGKWTHCSSVAIANMLWLFQLAPDSPATTADTTGIPESGNGIPDILDEARWGLEWLLKMQHESGAVYHKVDTEPDFAWGRPPEDDPYPRTVKWTDRNGTKPSTVDAGDLCGVMSLASRVYTGIDPAFAERCRTSALRAWEWIKKNPGTAQTDPYYTDNDTRQELFWAAAEIHVISGGKEGGDHLANLPSLNWIGPVTWQEPELYGALALLTCTRTGQNLKAHILNRLTASAEWLSARAAQHPFGHTVDRFFWSSNFHILGAGQVLAAAYRLTGRIEFRDAALGQLHYILGHNALGLSFVTGYGGNRVRHPYHWPYFVYGVTLPGWVSGGANPVPEGADPLLVKLQKKGTPPALCFVDACGTDGSWASNEGTLAMTSALMFLAGLI
ncbi:MAG: glycoside hydrolase family 9 protein [Spirochaetales bacterium]|nr:glycoside hydrolase family 9 protein [Spirochaetales bacterium]